MQRLLTVFVATCTAALLHAQAPPEQIAQERKQAELEVPKLIEALALKPSAVVADVGAGGGAISIVLARSLTSGRVIATDISPDFLDEVRAYAKREGLSNVSFVLGLRDAANLPAACCDAILMRNVYHHLYEPEAFMRGVTSALRPAGQLAIVDFPARPGSALPKGVRANREGNGIRSALVEEEMRGSGLTHVRTIEHWPTGETRLVSYLVLFRKP